MMNVLSYFFFSVFIISSLCIVLLQNTFFALLFLILSFFMVSIIFFFLECEFLALILIIMYVGAVAVLLLFVLMMLETKLKNLSKNIMIYFPFGVFMNCIFLIEFIHLTTSNFSANSYVESFSGNSYLNWYLKLDSLTDLEVYGQILYTQFVLQFLIVGLVLFLALVGVVFLMTKPVYANFKSQTSFCQLSSSFVEQNLNQMLL